VFVIQYFYAFIIGCNLTVRKSVDNRRLFLGGIPKDKTSAQVFEEIKNVTEGVTEASVVPAYKNKTMNNGHAHLEYESHR
jgi:hypothetical protein